MALNEMPKSEPIAALRLSGDRFDPHGMPTSSLVEFVAFEELVRELSKVLYKKRTKAKKLPPGFNQMVGLRLTEVQDGCSNGLLERPVMSAESLFGEAARTPFEDLKITHELIESRKNVEELIECAASGKKFPDIFRQIPRSLIKNLGKSLKPGEIMQVGERFDDNWNSRPAYSQYARKKVIDRLSAKSQEEASISGPIEQINTSNKTCCIRDGTHGLVKVPYSDTGFRIEINESVEAGAGAEYFSSGLGTLDSEGKLLLLDEVDVLRPVEQSTSLVEALEAVSGFRSLEEGWIDGEDGSPLNDRTLDSASQMVNLLYDHHMLTPFIYPTPEGGVQLEWSVGIYEISMEIDPEGRQTRLRRTNINDGLGSYFSTQNNEDTRQVLKWLNLALG